jgi:hypothetical protein
MTDPRTLQSTIPEVLRTRLATLEAQVASRETMLRRVTSELLALQNDYFRDVGALHAQRDELERAVADIEIRLGLRPRPDDLDPDDDAGKAGPQVPDAGCGNRGAPSADLKRVFRDIAKAIHPDRAMTADDPARFRRHSLMAEANRAYAERDEDRLRLILRAWERSPDSVVDDDPEADRLRVERRVAQLDERLVAIEAELAELRTTAIWRLKTRIDEAREQGWNLFAEIVNEVSRQISRARSRLVALQKLDPGRPARPVIPSAGEPT